MFVVENRDSAEYVIRNKFVIRLKRDRLLPLFSRRPVGSVRGAGGGLLQLGAGGVPGARRHRGRACPQVPGAVEDSGAGQLGAADLRGPGW